MRSGFKRGWEQVTGSDDRRLIYGDFMRDDEAYAMLPSMDNLIARMTANLEDFNATSKRSMELVLFPFAVEHVCRILRVIKQPFGNALLAGVGGSGRQSLVRLAAAMWEFTCHSIEITRTYDSSVREIARDRTRDREIAREITREIALAHCASQRLTCMSTPRPSTTT